MGRYKRHACLKCFSFEGENLGSKCFTIPKDESWAIASKKDVVPLSGPKIDSKVIFAN